MLIQVADILCGNGGLALAAASAHEAVAADIDPAHLEADLLLGSIRAAILTWSAVHLRKVVVRTVRDQQQTCCWTCDPPTWRLKW